ncbi:MAG: hypothetical protein K1X78_17365 [Verrucomicrobiaceae bacterium]|nr:hypothetical protein [Verrucomicrobiaceae bacterium]
MNSAGSLLGRILREIMSIGFCFGLPAAYMMLFPVATTVMERRGEVVTATCIRRIFFVVPCQTESVSGVTRIDHDIVRGSLSRTLRSGDEDDRRRPATRAEDMSSVIIVGTGGSIDVPVSPVDLDVVRRRMRDFVVESREPELRVFTVANWKWSVVGGGLLCVLPVLYLVTLLKTIVSRASKIPAKGAPGRPP